MTREEFKLLFGLNEGDPGMEHADELHEEKGTSWFEIARSEIATMNHLLLKGIACCSRCNKM